MSSYLIGNASITFKDGWSEIELNSGAILSVPWTEKPGDKDQAAHLGYASAVDMNRDHDALHLLVAHLLTIPDSGPLTCGAGGPIDPLWQFEEDIVFAIQRYLAAKRWTATRLLERWRC